MKNTKSPAVIDASYWWVYLLQGALGIIIGWMLVANPVKTTVAVVVTLGLYWLISGVLEIVFSLFDINKKDSHWGLRLFGGIISLIAGLFVVNNPLVASAVTPVMLMYVISFLFIMNGIIYMVAGHVTPDNSGYSWTWGSFFLGILYTILGFVLLSSPTLVSVSSVIFATALLMIFSGFVQIFVSFQMRKEHKAN